MKFAIVFSTIEGHSGKVARFVKTVLDQAGDEARLCETDKATAVSVEAMDGVILVAPVHERRHPARFEATVTALSEDLQKMPSLMLSVSLSAAFGEGLADAQDYLGEMKMRTGLKPTQEALVAGAVKLDRYDYFAEQVVKWVVLRDRDLHPASGNQEFTDWDALRKTVLKFLQTARSSRPSPPATESDQPVPGPN